MCVCVLGRNTMWPLGDLGSKVHPCLRSGPVLKGPGWQMPSCKESVATVHKEICRKQRQERANGRPRGGEWCKCWKPGAPEITSCLQKEKRFPMDAFPGLSRFLYFCSANWARKKLQLDPYWATQTCALAGRLGDPGRFKGLCTSCCTWEPETRKISNKGPAKNRKYCRFLWQCYVIQERKGPAEENVLLRGGLNGMKNPKRVVLNPKSRKADVHKQKSKRRGKHWRLGAH